MKYSPRIPRISTFLVKKNLLLKRKSTVIYTVDIQIEFSDLAQFHHKIHALNTRSINLLYIQSAEFTLEFAKSKNTNTCDRGLIIVNP